jgi:hypothetical protein
MGRGHDTLDRITKVQVSLIRRQPEKTPHSGYFAVDFTVSFVLLLLKVDVWKPRSVNDTRYALLLDKVVRFCVQLLAQLTIHA